MLRFELSLRAGLPAGAELLFATRRLFIATWAPPQQACDVIKATSENTNLDQWCLLVAVLTGCLKTNNLLQMWQSFMAPPRTATPTVSGHRSCPQEDWTAGL